MSAKVTAPPYQIGQFYEVPVAIIPKIYRTTFWGMKTIPIIGPPHNDDKTLNVTVGNHLHVDWRFVPKLAIRRVLSNLQD